MSGEERVKVRFLTKDDVNESMSPVDISALGVSLNLQQTNLLAIHQAAIGLGHTIIDSCPPGILRDMAILEAGRSLELAQRSVVRLHGERKGVHCGA